MRDGYNYSIELSKYEFYTCLWKAFFHADIKAINVFQDSHLLKQMCEFDYDFDQAKNIKNDVHITSYDLFIAYMMQAMRQADSTNTDILKFLFSEIWNNLYKFYHGN